MLPYMDSEVEVHVLYIIQSKKEIKTENFIK
jgi:hypothetical protein